MSACEKFLKPIKVPAWFNFRNLCVFCLLGVVVALHMFLYWVSVSEWASTGKHHTLEVLR